jgi:hypothetical protein
VVAGLADREVADGTSNARVPLIGARASELEREFDEHGEPVMAMLGAQFPRLTDPEEIYQEAWADCWSWSALVSASVTAARC